jgi:NAD(P)H-nitrite reductase large subunit
MSQIMVRTKSTAPFLSQPDDDLIICRCEEITKGEIRKAIHDGMRTINEVKRYLRAGMGLCQGQTCQRLVLSIIAGELKMPSGELGRISGRMPVRPAVMEAVGKCTERAEGVERYDR